MVKAGYKRTDYGMVPVDWKFVSAKEVCTKIQDGTHFSPKLGGNDYLYITSKNIRFGWLDVSNASRIDSQQHRQIYKRCDVKKGDLLLTKDGANTGNAALNNLNEEFSLLSSVAFLRVDESKYIPGYFLQQILAPSGQQKIQEAMAGNAITRLTLEKIKKLDFLVPPTKAEQEAIAGALSDADALIESLEQLLTKKRQIKQGTMQELLTGKRRLPGFNGKWEEKFMSELFDFCGGFSASREQLSSNGHPYLHYGDIHASTKTYINVVEEQQDIPKLDIPIKKISASSLLADGDVVFVDASEDDEGTSKHVVVKNAENIPFISGLHTIVAKSKSTDLVNEYKKFCFQTLSVKQQFRFYSVGTKVSGISKSNIGIISLPIPCHKEQFSIAEGLSDMDSEIAALEEKLTKAKALKQGMMQELLTGRIRLV
jgi:type I restriction enzyme S subunit